MAVTLESFDVSAFRQKKQKFFLDQKPHIFRLISDKFAFIKFENDPCSYLHEILLEEAVGREEQSETIKFDKLAIARLD